MEQNFKHIDNLFREELGGYTESPPPAVWEALEKRLDSAERKRPGFPYLWLWYILAVMVVAGGAALVWRMNNHSYVNAIAATGINKMADPATPAQQAEAVQPAYGSQQSASEKRSTAKIENEGRSDQTENKNIINAKSTTSKNSIASLTPNPGNEGNGVQSTNSAKPENKNIAENIPVEKAEPQLQAQPAQKKVTEGGGTGYASQTSYVVNNRSQHNIRIAEAEPMEGNGTNNAKSDDPEEDMVFGRRSTSSSKQTTQAKRRDDVYSGAVASSSAVPVMERLTDKAQAPVANNKQAEAKQPVNNVKRTASPRIVPGQKGAYAAAITNKTHVGPKAAFVSKTNKGHRAVAAVRSKTSKMGPLAANHKPHAAAGKDADRVAPAGIADVHHLSKHAQVNDNRLAATAKPTNGPQPSSIKTDKLVASTTTSAAANKTETKVVLDESTHTQTLVSKDNTKNKMPPAGANSNSVTNNKPGNRIAEAKAHSAEKTTKGEANATPTTSSPKLTTGKAGDKQTGKLPDDGSNASSATPRLAESKPHTKTGASRHDVSDKTISAAATTALPAASIKTAANANPRKDEGIAQKKHQASDEHRQLPVAATGKAPVKETTKATSSNKVNALKTSDKGETASSTSKTSHRNRMTSSPAKNDVNGGIAGNEPSKRSSKAGKAIEKKSTAIASVTDDEVSKGVTANNKKTTNSKNGKQQKTAVAQQPANTYSSLLPFLPSGFPFENLLAATSPAAPDPALAKPKIIGTFKADSAIALVAAKQGETKPDSMATATSAKRNWLKGWDIGVKGGYERGFNNNAAQKMVIAPFLEYKLNSKFSVLLQPAVKSSSFSWHAINGTQSFYNIDHSKDKVTVDSFLIFPIGGNPTYRKNYTFTQTHDSIVKSYGVGGGTYVETELPILLQYHITPKLSVYGGLNIAYSKLIGISEHSRSQTVTEVDSSHFGITGYTQPTYSSVFTYANAPLSSYKGPLYPSPQGGLLRMGYMLGFSYEFKNRWLFDCLIQQGNAKSNVQGGYNVNTALSATYFRLTLGRKLFSKK